MYIFFVALIKYSLMNFSKNSTFFTLNMGGHRNVTNIDAEVRITGEFSTEFHY